MEKSYRHILLGLVLALAGSIIFVTLFSVSTFNVGAFDFGIKFSPGWKSAGTTEIKIPPVGEISAHTHKTPVTLVVTLDNIDMKTLGNMFQESVTKEELVNSFSHEIFKAIRTMTLRILLLAAVGGVLGIALMRSRRFRDYLMGALVGSVFIGMLLLGTYFSYDIHQFQNPQYRGAVKAAPWMVGLAEGALVNVNKLGDQIQVVTSNFYDLFQRVDTLQSADFTEDSLKILQVSDIHNNPAAYQFIKQVVQNFDVSLVIDTGDITDYGTPLETNMLQELDNLGVPYVFVAGNHDSPEVVAAMKKIPNVTVLDQDAVTREGVTIAGSPDPASYGYDIAVSSDKAAENQAEGLKKYLLDSGKKPTIIATHTPEMARLFAGMAPIILNGHDHRFSIAQESGSVIVDAGTSGAAGIRDLQSHEETPYSVALLHLNQNNQQWQLSAVDMLKIDDMDGGFTLTRKVFSGGQ